MPAQNYATIDLGTVEFYVTCEHCEKKFEFTIGLAAHGEAMGVGVQYQNMAASRAKSNAASLWISLKKAVKTGNPDRLSWLYGSEKCPHCDYTQSWMQDSIVDSYQGTGIAAGGGLGCLTGLFFLYTFSSVVTALPQPFRFLTGIIVPLGCVAFLVYWGFKFGDRYGTRALEEQRRIYGTPERRNPVIRWGDYDPALDPDPPWKIKERASELPKGFQAPAQDYQLSEYDLQKKYGYIKGTNVFHFIESERRKTSKPDSSTEAAPRRVRCQCLKCGKRIRVSSEKIGRRGKYPNCGERFILADLGE